MQRIKVRTVIEAIRKNGLPKTVGAYQRFEDPINRTGPIVSACAMGQAAINLKVNPTDLSLAFLQNEPVTPVRDTVFMLNDSSDMTVPEIADFVEKKYPHLMDRWIEVSG